jgi:ssDNA-binding Zn-finger/Zn-ribbon topoisomerase 1
MMRIENHIALPVITRRAKTTSSSPPECDSRIAAEPDGEKSVQCPHCGSDAYYRYGKSAKGKKRYLCLSCNRQYTLPREGAMAILDRPLCPACQSKMHIYRRQKGIIRFRCGNYPNCKIFVKIAL